MFELSLHGADTHVGTGPSYPWGGLYGGQIVAQALRAATLSVDDPDMVAHSIRAYFIRRGDASEPVRYEVDRIRNGRSFATRRVVARQANGAILNAESSFQRREDSPAVATVTMPEVPHPGRLTVDGWSPLFERASVPDEAVSGAARDGAGRSVAWMRVGREQVESSEFTSDVLHRCWLAFMSDDLPTDAVFRAHPGLDESTAEGSWFGASLDHTIWFHRPFDATEWHLHDFSCVHFVGGRGLALGYVFGINGEHVATVAQEVLMRDLRGER